MAVTLELKPEVEVRVQEEALAQGLPVAQYLATLIETQVGSIRRRRPTLDAFTADLEALAEGSENLPVLPPEALTREAIYGEHD